MPDKFDKPDRVDREEQDDPVVRILAQVSHPKPPKELTTDVMARVAAAEGQLSAWNRWRRASRALRLTNFRDPSRVDSRQRRYEGSRVIKGEAVMGKKIIWGIAGLGAAAILGFAVRGFPPTGPGTEATIGQAKRDQTPQVKQTDVKTKADDEKVQQFLQSDTFDKMIKDPSARVFLVEVSKNAALAQALKDPALVQALATPGFVDALVNHPITNATAGQTQALSNPAVAQALANNSASATVNSLFANPAVTQALSNPAIAQALANPGFYYALATPAVSQAFANPSFAIALGTAGFYDALVNHPNVSNVDH